MNRTRFALLATLVALFAADTASAAPTWLLPQTISGPSSTNSAPDIAVNARGDAVAAWLRKSGSELHVYASTRPAGGAWRTPDYVPSKGVNEPPRVGIDGSGHAEVISAGTYNNKHDVWMSGSMSDGSFQTSYVVDSGPTATTPVIAVNERGDAVAAWGADFGIAGGVYVTVRSADGIWSKPDPLYLAFGAMPGSVDVAIDPSGQAVAAWTSGAGAVEAAFYQPGSGWAKEDTLEPAIQSVGNEPPRAAIDGAGRATVIWSQVAFGKGSVHAAGGSPGSGWAPAQLKGFGGREPDLAVAADGRAVAAWKRKDNGHQVIEASLRPAPGAAWADPVVVSGTSKDSGTPSAAIDPQGNALVAWDQVAAVGHMALAADWRAGGSQWGAPHAFAAGAAGETTPRVAFDAGGDAVAAFVHGSPIQAADFDAAPALSGVQAPASGAPGETLAFSASATDLWSTPTINWDFGDGATATGSAVSHAYAAPSDYTVKVTARDAVGNETSATRVVHVPAPAVPSSTSPAPHQFAGLTLKSQRVAVKKRIGRVTATCPVGTVGACKGTLRLLSGKKVVARARFNVKPGRTVRIRVKLRRVPGTLRASATAHDGLGATKITGAKLKLRRG